MKNNYCLSVGIDIKFSNINNIITTGTIRITSVEHYPTGHCGIKFSGIKYLSFHFHHIAVGG